MNLKELTWPLRLYWDLPEDADKNTDLKICDEVLGAKILFLGLRANQKNSSCSHILDRLKGKNIAVSLTLPLSALNASIYERIPGSNGPALFLETGSIQDIRTLDRVLEKARDPGPLPGISFILGRENYRDIPRVISICMEKGISHLVFPIQRLLTEPPFYLSETEEEELSLQLEELRYEKLRLTIHDPFIWKLFSKEKEYQEGACQAANSMLFISPEYHVYPCPAMPLNLGDLCKTSLREIILSEKKKELQRSLILPPDECARCIELNYCHGGCRGRAYVAAGSLKQSDPACHKK